MAMKLEQKQEIVAEVNQAASRALSAVVSDYRGLTVGQMTEMRAKARQSGVYLRVMRNTLARRAVAGTEFECMVDALVGPTLLAFSNEDPGAAARLLKDYAKQYEALNIKALAVGGRMYGPEEIDRLAKLPTRDEAIALLMSVMLAPVAKLARTLNEVPGKLVRTIAAIKEQKQAAA
ncbi:MAG: 50S ribosomal protein L10 [Pseudomonadales bacterium]|nr:50S ribosomal protein L10 [Pseudomonadales bacterium]